MNPLPLSIALALAAALTPLPGASATAVAPLQRQDAGGAASGRPSETHVHYVDVEHADAYELATLFTELFPRGSEPGAMPAFHAYRDRLLVQTAGPDASRYLDAIAALDVAGDSGASSSRTKAYSLRAKHLTQEQVLRALEPFHGLSLGVVGDGTVVVRGPERDVDEAVNVVVNMDRPQPQVRYVVHLLRAAEPDEELEPDAAPLPEALVANLAELVPARAFERLATAAVRAGALEPVVLESTADGRRRLQLELRPGAYDPASGALTLDRCGVTLTHELMDGKPERQTFQTSTTLTVGEYTVLGAVGRDPLLLVLQVVPAS